MLSDPTLSYQDTGEVMNCTMSIARHCRGRRLQPFLVRVLRAMVVLIDTTHRPAVVALAFGYVGQLLAVCRAYLTPVSHHGDTPTPTPTHRHPFDKFRTLSYSLLFDSFSLRLFFSSTLFLFDSFSFRLFFSSPLFLFNSSLRLFSSPLFLFSSSSLLLFSLFPPPPPLLSPVPAAVAVAHGVNPLVRGFLGHSNSCSGHRRNAARQIADHH